MHRAGERKHGERAKKPPMWSAAIQTNRSKKYSPLASGLRESRFSSLNMCPRRESGNFVSVAKDASKRWPPTLSTTRSSAIYNNSPVAVTSHAARQQNRTSPPCLQPVPCGALSVYRFHSSPSNLLKFFVWRVLLSRPCETEMEDFDSAETADEQQFLVLLDQDMSQIPLLLFRYFGPIFVPMLTSAHWTMCSQKPAA